MSIEALAEEAATLAEAYVIAAAVRGREQAIGANHEAVARRVEDAAFSRFLKAAERLTIAGGSVDAARMTRDALLDAMHAASTAQRDALNAQRSVA